jgi:crossover junction endodeoxyribonuclease RusA
MLTVFVAGKPAPQGSKRHLGHGVMLESSKAVAPWRHDVRQAFLNEHGRPRRRFTGAVGVGLVFVMPRPAATPVRTTPHAIRRPDLDKLCRAVLDALTSAGTYEDDARVVTLRATKRLAERNESTGCHVSVWAVESEMDL